MATKKETAVKKGTTKKTAPQATPGKPCSVEGCKRPYRAKGYCAVHFKKWRRGELTAKPRYRTCGAENCRKPVFKKGYCEQHYSAWSASKKPQAPAAEAPKAEATA